MEAFITLIIAVFGLLIVLAPLFIWNRLNEIKHELIDLHRNSYEQANEIIKLLTDLTIIADPSSNIRDKIVYPEPPSKGKKPH